MKENSPLKRMKLVLPRELGWFIEEKVSSGEYHSGGEVVVEALWTLRQSSMTPDERRADLEQALMKGIESGEARPWDKDEFLQEVQKRTAERKRAYAIDDIREVLAFLETLDSTDTERMIVETVQELAPNTEQSARALSVLIEILDRLKAIEGVRQGLESMKEGRGRPAREVLEELRKKHGIPLRAEEQAEWSSVKERVPEDNQAVLVTCRHGAIVLAYWHGSDRHWEIAREDRQLHFTDDDAVTHWMKLPRPPGGKKCDRHEQ